MAEVDTASPEGIAVLSARAASRFTWAPRAVVAAEEPPKEKRRPRGLAGGRHLSKDALDWLYDLCQHPFQRTTVRDRFLRLSAARAKRARDELEEAGLVKRHVVQTGRRGGQLVLEEVTEGGYEHLAQMQVAVKRPAGKGGYVHKFWQHRVAEKLGEMHDEARVGIEDAGSGKSVDVSFYFPSPHGETSKAVAYEILVKGEEKEVVNVRKDVESGFDEVVLCVDQWATAERLRERIRAELGAEMASKARFELLSQFLE